MKNFSRLKFSVAACAMLLLGSCSKTTYTFAPNTGAYHGAEKTAVAVSETNPGATTAMPEQTAQASAEIAKPVAAVTPQTEAAQALAAAFSGKASTTENATGTTKKLSLQNLKQLKKSLKQLDKKDIKDGKQVQIDQTVKLFLVLGIIFLLLGLISHIFWQIGIILLIVALVFLLLNTL